MATPKQRAVFPTYRETISKHSAKSCDYSIQCNRDMTFPDWETLTSLHLWGNDRLNTLKCLLASIWTHPRQHSGE